jgi:hypothetical protein
MSMLGSNHCRDAALCEINSRAARLTTGRLFLRLPDPIWLRTPADLVPEMIFEPPVLRPAAPGAHETEAAQ